MCPKILDEVELLARVGRKPGDLNPFSEAMDLLTGAPRGVRRTIVQHEDDLLTRATSPSGQKIEQTNGVFRNRILPESVREQERPVRIAESPADPDPVVLSGRFDPQRLPSKPIGVGGDGEKIEAHPVPVP